MMRFGLRIELFTFPTPSRYATCYATDARANKTAESTVFAEYLKVNGTQKRAFSYVAQFLCTYCTYDQVIYIYLNSGSVDVQTKTVLSKASSCIKDYICNIYPWQNYSF